MKSAVVPGAPQAPAEATRAPSGQSLRVPPSRANVAHVSIDLSGEKLMRFESKPPPGFAGFNAATGISSAGSGFPGSGIPARSGVRGRRGKGRPAGNDAVVGRVGEGCERESEHQGDGWSEISDAEGRKGDNLIKRGTLRKR